MNPSARRRLVLAALVLLLAAVAVAELPGHARSVDVLLYASAAVRANAEGALPYVAAWIEKGPLAMGLYQVLFAWFGDYDMIAIAATWFVLALAGMVLAWRLADAMGAARGAPWAGALFAVAVGPLCGTLNTEIPASVGAATAVLVWSGSLRSRRPLFLAVVAGAFGGAAFLCRQNAGALWPLLVAAEALRAWTGSATLGDAARRAAALTAGFWAIGGVPFVVYGAIGAFDPFWFCFYEYNRGIYIAATRVTAGRILTSPWTAVRNFLLPVPVTGVLGLVGVGTAFAGASDARDADARVVRLVVAGVSVGLTLSLFTGLRFFPHYFALVLPMWAALGGLAVERLSGPAGKARSRVVAIGVIVGLIAPLAVIPWRDSARRVVKHLRLDHGGDLGDPLYWPGRDAHAARVAAWIRDHSDESDRIFVWGMRPHVYAYARRTPATRFVTCTFLTGLVPWERSAPAEDTTAWVVPGAWAKLMEDLSDAPPRFVVDASQDHLFGQGAYSIERYRELDEFLNRAYEPVFEYGDPGGSGEGDRMVVWQRVDKPG